MKQLGEKDAQYGRLLGILHQLGQSRQNKQVLDAYKAGLQAFRSNLDRFALFSICLFNVNLQTWHVAIADR
jgi:hypothetical protein